MLDLGALKLSIVTDTANAKKEISNLKDTVSQAGESMTKMGATLTKAVTLPILGLATVCVKTASDVSESMNKVDAVFGKSSDEVTKWSDKSASSFGMSKSSFLDYVSTFGGLSQDLLKMNEADSAKFSKQILQRSADISSYYNMTIEESNSLMQQLYSGETDGWKRLSITINDTTMQEYAHSKGIQETISNMSLQEKTQLRIEMAMEKTARAEGDFTKTKAGLANSSRILQANLSDLSVVIGTALLPTVTSIVGAVNDVLTKTIEWAKANPELVDVLIKVAGALALIGPVLLVVGTAMKLATTLGQTMALAFSPVSLIIAGVIAAIALLALAWSQNLGGIRDKTAEAFNTIKATFETVAPILQEIFSTLWSSLKSIWETVGIPIFSALGEIIKVVANIFATAFPVIVEVVTVAFNAISLIWTTVLKPVFDVLIAIIKVIYEAVKINFGLIKDIFTIVFGAIKILWNITLKPVFDAFILIVKTLYEKISKPLNTVKDLFGDVFGFISDKVQKAVDLVQGLIDKVKNAVTAIANITGGGSSSGGTTTKTKYFADGGILTKATTFGFMGNTRLVGGEAGAEAIIPLDRLPQLMKDAGIGENNITVNNYSPEALNVAETARLYKQAQRELALGL